MDVDVIVIGSGQAGVPLATRLAQAGKTVLIAERARFGGTCINYGCTPTKTMIGSARAAHQARTAGRLGVRTGTVSVDLAAVIDRKDAIVRHWSEGIAAKLRSTERVRVVEGHARFVGEREVEVGGQRFRGGTVIINSGGRAVVPRLPGLEDVPFLDNHGVMRLRELPRHLLVLGGGYIGCELGQMFRRFGAEVTIVDSNEHLLSREDPEISSAVEEAFRAEGITLALRARTQRVAREGADIVLSLPEAKTLRGSHLLVAVGRRPNTDDLGCVAAGVKLDPQGSVVVDESYATSARGVYAVGDVTGGPQFTHTSWDDHRVLYDHLMGKPARRRSDRHVPYAVFTDPQVAGVGLSEKEARQKGIAYEIATMPFGEIARAVELDEKAGTMKLLIDPKTERILGCRLVGAEAGELIHVFVALVQAGASVRAIVDAEMVHPTFSEGLQQLALQLPRFQLR